MVVVIVPGMGLEPIQACGLQHFKCCASTDFATPAVSSDFYLDVLVASCDSWGKVSEDH